VGHSLMGLIPAGLHTRKNKQQLHAIGRVAAAARRAVPWRRRNEDGAAHQGFEGGTVMELGDWSTWERRPLGLRVR
jgi:hypothetical protein